MTTTRRKLAEARGLEDGAYDTYYAAVAKSGESSDAAQRAYQVYLDRKAEVEQLTNQLIAEDKAKPIDGPASIDDIGDWLERPALANRMLKLHRCDHNRTMYEIALEFDAPGVPRQSLPNYQSDGIMRPDLDGLVCEQLDRPIVQWMPTENQREAGHEQGPLWLVDNPSDGVMEAWEDAIGAARAG